MKKKTKMEEGLEIVKDWTKNESNRLAPTLPLFNRQIGQHLAFREAAQGMWEIEAFEIDDDRKGMKRRNILLTHEGLIRLSEAILEGLTHQHRRSMGER